MQVYCQWGIVALQVFAFIVHVIRDFATAEKQGGGVGFLNFLATLFVFAGIGLLFYGAGAYSELLGR